MTAAYGLPGDDVHRPEPHHLSSSVAQPISHSPAAPAPLTPEVNDLPPARDSPMTDGPGCAPPPSTTSDAAATAAATTAGVLPPATGETTPTEEAPPSYQNLAYNYDSGIWFNGFYFSNYDHLMSYRRTAIAYNYHFFGIRPDFKPPSNLPRPRAPSPFTPKTAPAALAGATGGAASTPVTASQLPASAPPAAAGNTAATPVPLTAATTAMSVGVSSTAPEPLLQAQGPGGHTGAAVAGGSAPQLAAGEPGADAASPCCSPGGSSACSNLDSDDGAASDGCGREAAEAARELLLLREAAAEHATVAVEPATVAAASTAAAPPLGTIRSIAVTASGDGGECCLSKAMAEHDLRDLAESPSKRVAREGGGFSWVGPIPVSWPVTATAVASASVNTGGVTPTAGAGAGVGAAGGAGATMQGVAGLPLPLSPLRCRVARPGGVGAGGGGGSPCAGGFPGQADGLSPVRGCGSPGAAACPPWLEPQMGHLLGRVVGEALWGAEESV